MNSIGNQGINTQNAQIADKKTSAIVKNSSSEINTADQFQASSAQDTKFGDKYYEKLIKVGTKLVPGAGIAVGATLGVAGALALGGGVVAGVAAGVICGVIGLGCVVAKGISGLMNAMDPNNK